MILVERKYVVAIIVLAISLVAGFFVLARQRGGMMTAAADLGKIFSDNRQWVEIKPRVVDLANETTGKETQNTAAGTKTKNVPAKEIKPVIKWCAFKTAGAAKKEVVINEVAWMGTPQNYSDEWIELKNISGQNIDLLGWQLQNKSQKIKVYFEGNDVLVPGGFYLLERTDDDALSEVKANRIYSGNLGNVKEALYLFDADCQLQDSAVAVAKWPAGDNVTKQTMERLPSLLWRTSTAAGGTPKAENR
ncbi:MAG: lamin tail domain-containing protein [Candidatus Paceibacterota bacterium]